MVLTLLLAGRALLGRDCDDVTKGVGGTLVLGVGVAWPVIAD